MEFTREALQLLQTTAQEAQTAKLLQIPGDGRTAYLQIGNTWQPIEIKPQPRDHRVASLQDLILYAEASPQRPAVVWHNDDAVVLLLDDLDRRDRVTFALEHSPQFECLVSFDQQKPWMDQRMFVRCLRADLGVDEAIIALFRRLDWRSTSEGRGEVLKNKESLGRSVESQVAGAAEIPDSLVFTVPVYDNQAEDDTVDVLCLMDFDTQNARIQLLPAPGELRRAVDARQDDIRTRLERSLSAPAGEHQVQIYYGTP